jgi:hypothetical protein
MPILRRSKNRQTARGCPGQVRDDLTTLGVLAVFTIEDSPRHERYNR